MHNSLFFTGMSSYVSMRLVAGSCFLSTYVEVEGHDVTTGPTLSAYAKMLLQIICFGETVVKHWWLACVL